MVVKSFFKGKDVLTATGSRCYIRNILPKHNFSDNLFTLVALHYTNKHEKYFNGIYSIRILCACIY